jgi:hypothetical protein
MLCFCSEVVEEDTKAAISEAKAFELNQRFNVYVISI